MIKFYSRDRLYYSFFEEYVLMMMVLQYLAIIRVLVGSSYTIT